MLLSEAVHVLRKHRVNAALTIQLFSQLFFYISAEVFNWLVSPAGAPYCSTAFGVRYASGIFVIYFGVKLGKDFHSKVCTVEGLVLVFSIYSSYYFIADP